MKANPLFSVIIPTYHRNDRLAQCLDCLAPTVQTLPAEHYEVIVSDDGSTTTAQGLIAECYSWVRWVAGPGRGPAANRNNGAAHARGEWLVFTDDDCLPDAQWLAAYYDTRQHHPLELVLEGRVYADRPRQSLADNAPLNETGGYLWSCNFAIQTQLFKTLNGFDERFPYAAMEDVELRLRLQQHGHLPFFVKSAALCHPWKSDITWKQLKQHQQSTLIYLSIHPSEANTINSSYYLYCMVYGLIKNTIANLFRFQFRGLQSALLQHFSFVQMAFILACRYRPLSSFQASRERA